MKQLLKNFYRKNSVKNLTKLKLNMFSLLSRNFATNQSSIITVPKYLKPHLNLLEKRFKEEEVRKLKQKKISGNKKIPVITSKLKPQYNYFYGQTYNNEKNVILVSDGWIDGKSKGDEIVFHPYFFNQIYRDHYMKKEISQPTLIEELGLRDELLENLNNNFNIKIASEIQRLAIPKILSNFNVLCSAETGSGKTIAYAAPIIQSIMQIKPFYKKRNYKSPLSLVVVPSRELVFQTATVFKKLIGDLDIGVATFIGGEPTNVKHSGFDVIITTIGLVSEHVQNGVYSLNNCRHLVIDEADTLMDDSFEFNVLDVLAHLKFKSEHTTEATQLVLVSATMPKNWNTRLSDWVDPKTIQVLKTSQLHRVMNHVRHVFYRVHKLKREENLLFLTKQLEKKNEQAIVFSNTSIASEWVYHFLTSHKMLCSHISKKMDNKERASNLEMFQKGKTNFLSCTDISSRGIDFKQAVHIINLDSPHFVSDYIHRAGRTGRLANQTLIDPTVHTFISFKQDVQMLQELEKSIRFNTPIQNVDANIKKYYNQKSTEMDLNTKKYKHM